MLRPRGRVPLRRGGLRRGVLRGQPARGAGDGSSAAPAAGVLLGGVRARRHRPAGPARQPHRGVHGRDVQRLRDAPAGAGVGGSRGLLGHGQRRERGVGPGGVRVGPGGPGGDARHRLLLLTSGVAPGVWVVARWGVRTGAGGRCDGALDAGGVRGVRTSTGPGPRRAVQVLRGRRRRHEPVGGHRRGAAGAALRRAPPGARGAGGGARQCRQPGRSEQRVDGSQRTLPAACDPPGARERGPAGVCGRRGRGPRHGDRARRSDRGAGAAGHLRTGASRGAAAVGGVGEVEHRPHPGRGGCGGRDQDGGGAAARRAAADAARRRALDPGGVVGRGGVGALRAGAVAAGRRPVAGRPAQGGSVVVRDQWHQRAPDPRGGAARRRRGRVGGGRGRALAGCTDARAGGVGARSGRCRGVRVGGVGSRRRGVARAGAAAVGVGRGGSGPARPAGGGRRVLTRGPSGVGGSRGHRGGRPRGAARRPRRAVQRGAGGRGRAGDRRLGARRSRGRGVPVHGPGCATGRDGAGAVRGVPGVQGGVRRGVRVPGRSGGAVVAWGGFRRGAARRGAAWRGAGGRGAARRAPGR